MHLRWGTYSELKDILGILNVEKLSRDQEEWGGLNVIVTSTPDKYDIDVKQHIGGKTHYITSSLSYGDTIIVTPYAKELSWLIDEVKRGPDSGEMTALEKVIYFTRIAIASQVIVNRTPEEMIMYILDLLIFEENLSSQENSKCRKV